MNKGFFHQLKVENEIHFSTLVTDFIAFDRFWSQPCPISKQFYRESPAVTCQPNGAETVVTITNGATALTNALISIQLGVGIQLLPATVQPLSGPSVSLTGINLNAPAFTVASWPANTTSNSRFAKSKLCRTRPKNQRRRFSGM